MVARLPATRECAVHQAREHLHGDVLEGERRPVEQLEDPVRRADLHERRDEAVAEGRVGVLDDCDQLGVADLAADERRHDPDGGVFVGSAGKGAISSCENVGQRSGR